MNDDVWLFIEYILKYGCLFGWMWSIFVWYLWYLLRFGNFVSDY